MLGEPSPHHFARIAQLIEIFAAVSSDARRKNLRLPCRRGNFVSFELTDDVQRAVHAVQAR